MRQSCNKNVKMREREERALTSRPHPFSTYLILSLQRFLHPCRKRAAHRINHLRVLNGILTNKIMITNVDLAPITCALSVFCFDQPSIVVTRPIRAIITLTCACRKRKFNIVLKNLVSQYALRRSDVPGFHAGGLQIPLFSERPAGAEERKVFRALERAGAALCRRGFGGITRSPI